MPRNHHRVVRQRQQLVVNGTQNLLAVSARQMRAPNAVAKQSVPRNQFVFLGNKQADAALRVPRRLDDLKCRRPERESRRVALDFHTLRRKELAFYPVRRSNREFDLALRLIADAPQRFAPVLTHTRPLDRIQSTFEMLEKYEDGACKITLTM